MDAVSHAPPRTTTPPSGVSVRTERKRTCFNCGVVRFFAGGLRAIGRAWGWRRRMEAGEFGPVRDLAIAVNLAESHVSRQLRLAYLAPEVLKRLVFGRKVTALTVMQLTESAALPWVEQVGVMGQSQVLSPTIDLHENLVHMPPPVARFHPLGPTLADLGRKHRAEPVPPETDV